MNLLQALNGVNLIAKPVTIDPTSLSKEDASVLIALIKSRRGQPDGVILRPNRPYKIEIDKQVVEIKLTNEIVARKVVLPNGKTSTRYSVIGNKPSDVLGSGDFGQVRRLSGTLKLSDENELVFRNDKHRVVKIENFIAESRYAAAMLEGELSQMFPELHGKNVTIKFDKQGKPIRSYIVLDEFPGCTLHSVIEADQYKIDMTVSQRFDLTLAILHDLQSLHDHGVLHRDLKPRNIMVDLANAKARIIDLGLGRKTEMPDGQYKGNKAYMAPEMIGLNTADVPADIYSIGLILCKLWRGGWRKTNPDYYSAMSQSEVRFIPDFQFANLNKQETDAFKHIISTMLVHNPNERASLQEVIQQIEVILIGYQMRLLPSISKEELKAIDTAYKAAVEAREAMRHLRMQLNQSQPHDLKSLLNEAVAKIDDTPQAIKCFTKYLRVDALMAETTRAKLLEKINTVIDEYELRINLMNLYDQFFHKLDELIALEYPNCEMWDCYHDAKELSLAIDAALLKKAKSKRELKFDVLNELVRKFDKCIADLTALLQKIDSTSTCQQAKLLIAEVGLFAKPKALEEPVVAVVNAQVPAVN